MTKGRPVYIEGRLGVEEWTDRDGKSRYTLEVQATDMQFISAGPRGDNDEEYSGGGQAEFAGPADRSTGAATASAPAPSGDDDIPF